jgi:ribosome biogenesis GTPase / thiamine phosphate phosphatase
LGWGDALQQQFELLVESQPSIPLQPARVIAEHRGAYQVISATGRCWAEPTGRLRHLAQGKLELPAVGDWVAIDGKARVVAVLPRKSAFIRKVAALRTEPQVVAANVDRVFIVTSANSDFNPRRIERYVAAIWESGASPVLVINKTDLCEDVDLLLASLGNAAQGLPVARVSALERRGGEQLLCHLGPQLTVALVGSSGVGKSTIANWLLGQEVIDTAEIDAEERGRHTTTHRELFALPGGGALIDTPGMRELTLWSDVDDLAGSFTDIEDMAQRCRFIDCQHQGQPGCVIQEALDAGVLEQERLQNFFKLQRELLQQEQRKQHLEEKQQKQKEIARAMKQRRKGPLGAKLR